ncbi:copper fist DNA binding domain-containing protein [Sporodiniella umbellata]|nr:copper fist DNA binding domain-containing protein [Sporodiniella umbellata]
MLINGIKFACSTCVKGHRSSTCRHSERPLIEIRKKGRPISQCDHCRDLRKRKQIHAKCTCVNKCKPPLTTITLADFAHSRPHSSFDCQKRGKGYSGETCGV